MSPALIALWSQIALNLLVQISLLAFLVLAIAYAVRRIAVWRYSIAYSGLIAAAILTVSSFSFQLSGSSVISIPLLPIEARSFGIDSVSSNLPLPGNSAQTDASFIMETPEPGTLTDLEFAQLGDGSQASGFKWIAVGMLVWLLGMILSLTSLFNSARRVRQLIASSERIESPLIDKVLENIQELDLDSQIVQTFSHEKIHSPVQAGLSRAVILLPTGFIEKASYEELEAVFIHELAHWHRKDNLANLFQKIVIAVFWFHPLFHLLDKIIERSREEICDNYVLAQKEPSLYGEILFSINQSMQQKHNPKLLAVSIFGKTWKLEHRIRELLSSRRDQTMKLSSSRNLSTQLVSIGLSLVIASCIFVPSVNEVQAQDTNQAGDTGAEPSEPRDPPTANAAETLRTEVFEAVSLIQELLDPEDDTQEPDLDQAKVMLDEIYENYFEQGNNFEKSTILNFHTNYYLMISDYEETIATFLAMLEIENLRDDIENRTLRSLGQLYAAEEQWQNSIRYYELWLAEAESIDNVTARGLSYGHYQLEQWESARDYWQQYLDIESEENLDRDDFAYLNGLHYTLNDFEAARELTQDMILRFNDPVDWNNLRAIHQRLDEDESIASLESDLGGALNLNSSEPEIAFASVVPWDADYLPLVAIAPMYPRSAADEGIEGWVLLEFTVDEQGRVVEDTIEVVDREPSDIFDRTSVRAVGDFIFQPRIIAGRAEAVIGVQYLFRFALEDDDDQV